MKLSIPLKFLVLFVFLMIGLAAFSQVASTREVRRVVTDTNAPVQLSTNRFRGHTYTFMGQKGPRTNNTGNVYIQFSSTNNSGGITLVPGGMVSITENLRGLWVTQFWIDADNINDGVIVLVFD